MKDYLVQYKIKNNYLYQHMKRAGMKTAADLSRASGVCQASIGRYLNLKAPARLNNGKFSSPVLKISKALKTLPEDLFPPQHLDKPLETNIGESEINLEEVLLLHQAQNLRNPYNLLEQKELKVLINKSLNKLPQAWSSVLRMRCGIDCDKHTLKKCAESIGVSPERVRQIEAKALRRLRHPARSKNLKPFW
jgi:RNA polymerase primary sigma factor